MPEYDGPEYDESSDDFALPALDESPATEAGVILAGLDAPRLLAGLGMAALADDPTLITLLVDQVRHSTDGAELTLQELHELGARHWRAVRPALTAAGTTTPPSGSVRQAWERAERVVTTAELGETGPAARAYLTACWLRHEAVDALTSTTGAPAVTEPAVRNSVSEVVR